MDKNWMELVEEYAKGMSVSEFDQLLELAKPRMWCRQCGTCCIIPELLEVQKPKGERCKSLTENNLCAIHERKPKWCGLFPYVERFEWMRDGVVGGGIPGSIKFCGIIKAFWEVVFENMGRFWR